MGHIRRGCDLGTFSGCDWPYAYRGAGRGPGVIPPGSPNFFDLGDVLAVQVLA